MKKILAVETSCDDTSVSIVGIDGTVYALNSAHQDPEHEPYGGIVPEIASRNHSIHLLPLIESTLKNSNHEWNDIDGFAVTNRPGLIGALIVGLVTVKTLALVYKKPWIGVNHLEGHLLAPFLRDEKFQPAFDLSEPFIALAVSGGHTSLYLVHGQGKYEILGMTKDDAAGEAFDKFAKMAGLGFPGGAKVDQLSRPGDVSKFDFPRGLQNDKSFDMSFSGLKSSAQRLLQELGPEKVKTEISHLCASYQEAVVDALIHKLDLAAKKFKIKKIVITGGVAANSRLRAKAEDLAKRKKYLLQIPPLRFCTDNAAMIGYAGILRLNKGESSGVSVGPSPEMDPQDFIQQSEGKV